jgi:hypothetical protein
MNKMQDEAETDRIRKLVAGLGRGEEVNITTRFTNRQVLNRISGMMDDEGRKCHYYATDSDEPCVVNVKCVAKWSTAGMTEYRPLAEADDSTKDMVHELTSMVEHKDDDADHFFEHIDLMLAHVRQPGVPGAQEDFASHARETLARLESVLPQALAMLNALDAGLKARR